jgi:O-antigen ligase
VLPFFSPNFFEPISSFYGEIAAFALGLMAVSLLPLLRLRDGFRLSRAGLMFLAFAALILLHAVRGATVYPQINVIAALYLLWAAALAVLVLRLRELFGLEALVNTLSWFLAAGALASAAIGLIQMSGVHTPLSPLILPQIHARIYANTGQPNHLANYLCLGLASIAYLWSTARLHAAVAAPSAVLLLLVLSASGSRGAWVYLPALFVLSLLFVRKMHEADIGRRLLIFSALAMICLLLIPVLAGSLAPERTAVAESMAQRMHAIGADVPIRLRMWTEAWLMFRSAPLTGIGFGQFAWNSFLLDAQLPAQGKNEWIVHHAHNLVMQIAAETGIIGLALLLGGVGFWLGGLRGQRWSPQLWWTAGILAILGIHSMLEYPLWYSYFLGIAAVTLASSESTAIAGASWRSGRAVLLLMLLLGWLTLANVYRDYRTMQWLQTATASDPATQSGDGNIRILLDLQRQSLFTPYIELALARRMTLNREHLNDKIALNGYVMRLFPNGDVVYRQAILLAMSGDRDAARVQWRRAAASYPSQRPAALRVVEVLAQAGEEGMSDFLSYLETSDSKEGK